jgi:hypothetical protein
MGDQRSGQEVLLLFSSTEKAAAFVRQAGLAPHYPQLGLIDLRTGEELTTFAVEQANFLGSKHANIFALDPIISPDGLLTFDGYTAEQLALNFPVRDKPDRPPFGPG